MSALPKEETFQSCMDLVEIKDTNGAVIRLKRYEGMFFFPRVLGNVKDHIEQIGKMNVRQDDIYITSYPKSGTHWIYEIVNMLVNKATDYCTGHVFIENTPVEKIAKVVSPRIFATHLPYRLLPRQLQENKDIKIINICRNPKDTCVSLYHYLRKCVDEMYDGEWSGLLDIFMRGDVPFGSWFDYINEWEEVRSNNPQILFLQYEHVIKNFRDQLLRLSQYLGIAWDENFYKTIEKKCSFSQMKNDKVIKNIWSNLSRDGTNPIFRKGEIGDWKNYFTVAQNESFDVLYDCKMENSTVQFQFV